MLTKDDLEKKPKGFVYCYGTGCEKAPTCLRNMALQLMEADRISFEVFHPQCVCSNGTCSKFLGEEKVEMQYGVKNLCRKLPLDTAKAIKAALINAFGRTEYYRKFRYEHPFTPKDQLLVKRIFEEHGAEDTPEYEYSRMELNWR